VSIFSGLFYDDPEESKIYHEKCKDNISLSDDHRRACKKFSLRVVSYQTTIDIPPELDTPETFHPTLGPKVKTK